MNCPRYWTKHTSDESGRRNGNLPADCSDASVRPFHIDELTEVLTARLDNGQLLQYRVDWQGGIDNRDQAASPDRGCQFDRLSAVSSVPTPPWYSRRQK